MVARIYKPARTAMQSGPARTKEWVLEYEPEAPREIDPLMGWTSSRDMKQQLQLELRQQGRGGAPTPSATASPTGSRSPSRASRCASPTPTLFASVA